MTPRVGFFDSGVGGLTVWREVVARAPELDTVYVADQLHLPYGPRPAAEILDFSRGVSRFLIDAGCNVVVVACNTASAAALRELRKEFGDITFVGMEPAVKPAVRDSRRGVIGVLATPAALAGSLFTNTVAQHAVGVQVVAQPCPGLVELIEAGEVEGPPVIDLLQQFLQPSLDAGADTIVLGCSHYPFLTQAIGRLVGPDVVILDPARAVAEQVCRQVAGRSDQAPALASGGHGDNFFFTTGDVGQFESVAGRLLGRRIEAQSLGWRGGALGR